MIARIRELAQKLDYNQSHANCGLWLDKMLRNQRKEDKEARRSLVSQVATIDETDYYRAWYGRWETHLMRYGAVCREAEALGRMAIGVGAESILETSITLHRTYGVPYIPGSALKGLAASFAHQYLGAEWQRGSDAHHIVFGTTAQAGYVTFFDAWYKPGSGTRIENRPYALHRDVLTVHHKNYYQQKATAPPADWDDPNPVPFLTATGRYLIALAAPTECEQWRDAAFQILACALKHEGIGAKTSSGYGRMRVIGLDCHETPG